RVHPWLNALSPVAKCPVLRGEMPFAPWLPAKLPFFRRIGRERILSGQVVLDDPGGAAGDCRAGWCWGDAAGG
ncbi:MAG: hypothetical protein ACK6EB_01040, partial [Planctomyces sp.]